MSTSWIFNTLISAILLPPLSAVLLCALGLCLRVRWPRLGNAVCGVALISLTILSTGAGALWLTAPLENTVPPLQSTRQLSAQAIVVLGGGRLSNAPEYGGRDVPNLTTLGRLRYGALLQRKTGLPLLVTGGSPDGAPEGEAVLMARVLRDEFLVPVRWVEDASDNTAQNAQFSARLLQQAQVRHIVLVTDALHMPRAQRVFERQGLQVTPAPTVFYSHGRETLMRFVPSAGALRLSHYALHEWLGWIWYRMHDQSPPEFGRAA